MPKKSQINEYSDVKANAIHVDDIRILDKDIDPDNDEQDERGTWEKPRS